MESFLWALNLVAVCVLCGWAFKEDNRPSEPGEGADAAPVDSARAKPGTAARHEKRRQFPRK